MTKTIEHNGKVYKVSNSGTYYHKDTNDNVIAALETVRDNNQRIKLYYGNPETGENWNEENDTVGYVGRSIGPIKIPLLVHNARSLGGGGLLDHCIVKIRESKGNQTLYQVPNYQQPMIEIKEGSDVAGYTHETWVNGKLYKRHKSLKSAELLKNKLG